MSPSEDTLKNDKFTKKYMIVSEVLNSVSHGIGFGLSIAGLVILIIKAVESGEAIRIVSYTIYGSTMILLFLFSTLYHSLSFTGAQKVMRILDHSIIYVFIAGTYTPLCLVTVKCIFGWVIFSIIWLLALVGIVFKAIYIEKENRLATLVYILMGWFCLVAGKALYAGLGKDGFLLLFLGGVSYTVGAIIYSMEHLRFVHLVWHIFVMLGVGLMYFSILLYA